MEKLCAPWCTDPSRSKPVRNLNFLTKEVNIEERSLNFNQTFAGLLITYLHIICQYIYTPTYQLHIYLQQWILDVDRGSLWFKSKWWWFAAYFWLQLLSYLLLMCQVQEIYRGNSGNSGRQVWTYKMSEGTSASAYVLCPFQTLVPRFWNKEDGDQRSEDWSKDWSWSWSRILEDELSRWELIQYSNWSIYMTCPKYLC